VRQFLLYFLKRRHPCSNSGLKLPPLVIIALAIFSFVCAQESQMRKGPYLIYPNNPSQMTVLWQLKNSDTCRLQWGLTPACTTGSVFTTETENGIDGHQHIHTLSELTPDRLYYYQITENNNVHAGSFRSAPPDSVGTTSFFVYGDTRTYPQMHDSVMPGICHSINDEPSHQTFLLHAGDWNSSSMESYWDSDYFNRECPNTMEVLSKIPVLGARGNHEDDAAVFRKYWPYPFESEGFYYAFDYGPVHVAVVDQYTDYSIGSKQIQWLDHDLARSDKPWKFILLHEPGFSDEGAYPNNRSVQKVIHPLCRIYGVNAVFGGHSHFYAHCIVDSVHHLTFGGGGGPLYQVGHTGQGLIMSETSLHYARVSVESDSAVVTVFRPDRTVIDRFSMSDTLEPEPPVVITKRIAPVQVYTVPAAKRLVIEIKDYKNTEVTLLDFCGRVMLKENITSPRTVIDYASYPRGFCCAQITRGTSAPLTRKILF
jgi:hypothetical protein